MGVTPEPVFVALANWSSLFVLTCVSKSAPLDAVSVGISATTSDLNVGAASLPVVGHDNTKLAPLTVALSKNAPFPPIEIILEAEPPDPPVPVP